MKIIGKGFIAKHFNKFKFSKKYIIYAAGVSNSNLKDKNIQQFSVGTFESPFYINLLFDFPPRDSQKAKSSYMNSKEDDLEKGQALLNSIISKFEYKGADNILIKNESMKLHSGAPVEKVFGTLDIPK